MIEKKDKFHILGGPKFDCIMMVSIVIFNNAKKTKPIFSTIFLLWKSFTGQEVDLSDDVIVLVQQHEDTNIR